MANVGYLDPDNVAGPILKQLSDPLSNLHWKGSNEPLRSINKLQLNFIKTTITPSHTKLRGNIVKENDQFYHSLILQSDNNKIPYLVIFFVKLSSIEHYRSKTRPLIRSWLAQTIENEALQIEWLIILVGDDSKSASLLGKPTLFAKLQTDMNSEGEEHCATLSDYDLTAVKQKQEWGILISLLKEKILSSFTKRLELYRDQLFLLQQRPVINPYFKLILQNYIMKVYHDMTLDEESLAECDKLLSSFTKLWRDGSLSFPLDVDGLSLDCFGENLLFDSNIEFDKLVLEEKMNVFQFHCYQLLFLSNCLLLLASSDSSLTFSTMHMVDLLKRVKLFITSITGLWTNYSSIPPKVFQFNYLLTDEFLSNDLVLRNIELNLNNPEVGNVSDIMEIIGELKMVQRDQLSKLGEKRNLKINGIMFDVPLTDVDSSSDFEVTYEPLKTPLSSQENFLQDYLSMTKAIIEGFNSASIKPRTVDILSTEIALIAYHNGDYMETKSILCDSFKYYNEQGWDYIGTALLKVYIECLEKTNSEDLNELVSLYLDLLSTGRCEDEESEETIKKIEKIANESHIESTLQKLFKVSVDDSWNCRGYNKYFVLLSLENTSKATFTVDNIVLNLQDQEGNTLSFTKDRSDIQKNLNVFELDTNDVIYDRFHFTSLVLSLRKLRLTYNFQDQKLSILPYPVSTVISNLSTNLSIPRDRKLNENSMVLTIRNGDRPVTDLKIRFLCGNTDLSLELIESEANGLNANGDSVGVTITKDKARTLILNIDLQIENDTFEIILPYSLKFKTSELPLLMIKYHLTYVQDGQTHNYISKADIDPSLSLAVTVQDIFKSSILFTNFSIGASDSKNPVRILDVDLSSSNSSLNSNYKIEYQKQLISNTVAFSGQPLKFYSKVKRLGKQVDDEDLLLKIKYRDLREECVAIVRDEFQKISQGSNFKSADIDHLLSKVFKGLEFKLSYYSFKNFIKLAPLNFEILKLSTENSKALESFFAKFTNDEGFEVKEKSFDEIERSLTIRVPMPLIPVIHDVELDFKRSPNYVIGSTIDMKLLLKTTTSWSGNPPLSSTKVSEPAITMPASLGPPTPVPSRPASPGLAPTSSFVNGDGKYWERNQGSSTSTIDLNLEETKVKKKKKMVTFESAATTSFKLFQLELQTFDNWLISGSKRFTFEIEPNGTHDFERDPMNLVLIPLKVGRIPLPKIEIKELDVESGELTNDNTGVEINYKNSSETLVVVSDSDKISFDL